jgi:sugar transferase EpsL
MWYRLHGKRLLDLALAVPALIILSPLLILIALWVRWTIGAPVLFRQQRPGLNGALFTLYKFRTMAEVRETAGRVLSDVDRLTPAGRWLRSTSLDELPELINIIRGDMSLVGPRPLLVQYLPLYSPKQMRRHDVRPGLTGWAQVHGRNNLGWTQKFVLDVWYVDHCSFCLDLQIMALTVSKVLRREGIQQAGQVTIEEFKGN